MGPGPTPVDLYRSGNGANARMDNVRPGDITVYQMNGVDWVQAKAGDGISTPEASKSRGKWWHLPKGTPFSNLLLVRNDYTGHWAWEPIKDMPLADYKSALAALHQHFSPLFWAPVQVSAGGAP